MYGPWILAIIFSSLTVVFGVLCVISAYLNNKYDDLYADAKWGSKEKDFYNKKANIWDSCAVVFLISAFVFLFFAIMACLIGGINIMFAKREILMFEQTRLIVEDAYRNGTDLDNIGMTQTIIEKNNWLANAKVKLEMYGNFSAYYDRGIDTMQYISLGGGV